MSTVCSANLFGSQTNQYIKTNSGDLIAVSGSGILERLILSDLRIPYKQILKSRIILKAGQTNYLLNHLGLGDNATFLGIKAIYDSKSIIETDNYVNWSYSNLLNKVNSFAELMILTGNSTNRIPQLYLTNPNTKYPVYLDVLVGVIDDTYSIFNDTLNQTGSSFVNLNYTDIHTHIVGESIVIKDENSKPLIYINLDNINSIEISGQILIIDDYSKGFIFLQFKTEYDTYQSYSLLNYVLENRNVNIDVLSPLEDNDPPIIYFYSNVGDNISNSYIDFNGSTDSVPYDTSYGYTFSTTISITQSGTMSGTYSILNKDQLIYLLIDNINDNRDGTMSMMSSNLIITSITGSNVSQIITSGTYSLSFNFSDLANNRLDGVLMNLYVI